MPRKKKVVEEEKKLFKCTKEENYDPKIIDRLKAEGITDISEVDPKCIDWYDIRKNMKAYPECTYVIAVGQRGNGKSYSTCKECLEHFRDTKKKFIYLRRWTDDVKTFACNTLFKPELIEEVFGPNYEIQYRNHVFTLLYTEVNEETGKERVYKEEIGYASAVSESKHRKGMNFINTDLIFYDEFIDLSGENVLANEWNKFENIVNTIKRANKVKVIMLANTVTKYSEYFTKFGINPDKVEQGEVKTYLHPNGQAKVVYEYCRYNCLLGYFVGSLTSSNMIATGQWEIPETDEIPSEQDEQVKEKLLFTAYLDKTKATIGMYVRRGTWYTYENINSITTPIEHEREFLVIRRILDDKKSSYFHLTNQKSLKNTHYHRLDLMLKDIFDQTDIDVKRELLMGRVFCDNMFTGDIFNEVWQEFNVAKIRELL